MKYTLKIFRGTPGKQYFEEFELETVPLANVISSLMEIQKFPVNKKGEKTTPVAWESGCLEEVCGSCSMLVNGQPRQACTALIEPIIKKSGSDIITLAPFTKFPLVRDLIVDRTKMFENLKKAHAWVDVDGLHDLGAGPKVSQKTQEVMYSLATCMTCGCCVEACPQSNDRSSFVGPQVISQVRLFNLHPTGAAKKAARLDAMMEEGGVSDCGNAQNCVRVCPKNIPLTNSIAEIGKQVTSYSIRSLFNLPEKEC